ncbi:thiolase C-terminal domain-containing protein [Amycolatopsis thermoflava]|uniref:thiolase C-terminal domain-containing protein n=1 Tax=Amycolatopsis thermoflava TaxID=84480 RepID=UPI0004121F53|nr:acetyl-CoA acetyltransferase [Amycolatopsis thermoflava]
MTQSFAGRAAVTGIGITDLSRRSGRSELHLAVTACRAALADAGLTAADVGAVLCYHLADSAGVNQVAAALGVPDAVWTNEIHGGGTQSASILGDAAMLIEGGIAEHVLVFRALNGRSGVRMGQARLSVDQQFTVPYGMLGPVHLFALAAQRWMNDSGATAKDLAAVVTQSRSLAAHNSRAVLGEPLDEAGYFASPPIATPLRRADCCLETDGGAALVVSAAKTADVVRPGSPRIHAVVRGGGPGASTMDSAADLSALFSSYLAEPLYRTAGMRPSDVELALLYDAYSPIVLQQLEDFGLAPRGESGAFVRAGETLPSGALPVNPHGGLLSEGYVHGLNNVLEAVRQLRGEGTNQERRPGVALCTGFGGSYGSAAVLVAG